MISIPSVSPPVLLQQHLPLAVLKPYIFLGMKKAAVRLQQHLPLAVLKPVCCNDSFKSDAVVVATALTACGIETKNSHVHISPHIPPPLQQHLPLAVLKRSRFNVFTVTIFFELQQHLPLAVLKLSDNNSESMMSPRLQQHLPLAVLKLEARSKGLIFKPSCNGAYRLRY